MKKLLLPLLALLFVVSCEKESTTDYMSDREQGLEFVSETFRSPASKVNICHYDSENEYWEIISVSENALPAHIAHGDVQLIDTDGDGYVTSENECGMPVDCDDTDAELSDNCCDEGIPIIDSEGQALYVALADEPYYYTWQSAKNLCAAKDSEDGCVWYLPSQSELNDLYLNQGIIGGFDQLDEFPGSYYWSSTSDPENSSRAFVQGFLTGNQLTSGKNITSHCRCVHR